MAMQRPFRCNAGVAASHFSQEEFLYAPRDAARIAHMSESELSNSLGKRSREYFPACQKCGKCHHSDLAADKCRRALDVVPLCQTCGKTHHSDLAADKCQRAQSAIAHHTDVARRRAEKAESSALRAIELAAAHCHRCGGTHKSDAKRIRCHNQRPALPFEDGRGADGVAGVNPKSELAFNRNVADFRKVLAAQEMVYCKHCSEAWFSPKPTDAVLADGGGFCVTERCSNCKSRSVAATASHAQRFSEANSMHPKPPPPELEVLTEIEEALISLHAPVLRVFRLRGGQNGYGGSCVALTQDIGAVARSLPRKMDDLDVVVFSKSIDASEEGGAAVLKTFRVRREVIRTWLHFLKACNPLYGHVQIESESIDALPLDSRDTLHHVRLRQDADVEPMMLDSGELIGSGDIQHMVLDGVAGNANSSEDTLKSKVLEWPKQSDGAVQEYGHPGLFAKCFPSVFPYGIGDPTSPSRNFTVSLSDGIHHLQKYAYITPENKLVWPFAQHRLAPYYAHDVHLRQSLLGQSTVFMKQHEHGDAEFPSTRDGLLEALEDPVKSVQMLKLINRYAGNCLGTNGYWSRRKEELVSLCESKPPHLWWTLSAADLHWPDLRRFVSDPLHAPHLVDAWFTLRVQEYVKWFFGDDCEWIWWRIEYQSRGSAHAHGCSRLKNFVDLDALYEIARIGRCAGATDEESARGAESEIELCRIADQFCCGMSLDPDVDALADARSPPIAFNPDAVHPASVAYDSPTLEHFRLADLLNKVQRHAHRKSYCGCDGNGCGKCRFHAPWQLLSQTHFVWTIDSENNPKGILNFKRNDRWMNTYHPVGMQAWNANMDIKLIYNIECLADYLCAYATKCEKLSKQALRTMSACARQFDDASGAQKIVRSMFIRGHGQRDMSGQEVAHCNLNMPLVRQNVKYVSLDLRKGVGVGGRLLDLDENAASLVVPSIMEWYGRRCDPSHWGEAHQHFAASTANCSLHDFVLQFNYTKRGKLAPRAQSTDMLIINAFPRIRSPRGGKLYPEYCKLQLTLHHPWTHFAPWSADAAAVQLWETVGGRKGKLDAAIVAAAALQDPIEDHHLSQDSSCDELLQGLHDAVYREVSDSFADTDWHQVHEYDVDPTVLSKALEKSKRDAQGQHASSAKRDVLLDAAQQSVVDAFCASQSNGRMLLIGAGGTGKSEILFRIKETLGERVLVTATTGKAAALIDGATVHSAINAPVKKKQMKELSGPALDNLQNRLALVTHLIIDEFSMINGSFLHWIDRRCQQAKFCSEPFGGLSVLLSGDPAQLAPMGGHPLWVDVASANSDCEAIGMMLYGLFSTVFCLTKNYRQGTAHAHDLADFLANYRMGALTDENWRWFESRSQDCVAAAEFSAASESGIHLYPVNDQVKSRNVEKLGHISTTMHTPVAIFPAKNSCPKAAKAPNKLAGGLDQVVCLSIGATVMVTQNLYTEQGIVNGASGFVVDFVKEGSDCVAVIVNIPKYRGPPLCGAAVERRTWVPIPRKEATWCSGKAATTCKREQFPLTLSFAITIHKSQGSTFTEPIVMDIGKSDRTCGSTYVALSRCTASNQVFHPGYARDRLTKNFDSAAFKCRMKEEQRLVRLHNARVAAVPSAADAHCRS